MPESPLHWKAYGAVLRTNVAWPGLEPAPAESPDLLTCHVERVSTLPSFALRNSIQSQGRRIRAGSSDAGIHIQVDQMLLASLQEAGRRIHCWVTRDTSDAVAGYWLLRQILPIARLTWGDIEILHAAAVRIDNEAAAFLAPSCHGKSTLAGHFVERGHPLITDDHLVLQRQEEKPSKGTWVLPTLPFYRNYRAVETLGRYTERHASGSTRLRVIYVLKNAEPDSEVRITRLPDSLAALELLHEAPYNLTRLPCLVPLMQQRFQFVSQLPLNVHVRRLDVPRALERLPEVAASIAADFRWLGDSPHVPV